ncbi:unnamed protein product [Litomosoides sigmodontis]|uniref:tRNA (guanine(9)-N(1))-methyltransferase n=1 Tax=Litomosoides sigmodontis TaxID=42156 RepID=A0A3P6V281_LITSI|nr:unnamed protein product [Litomosoides sigmodontis]
MTSLCLAKNLKPVTNFPPRPVITWDRAERIRRNKEIWDNKNSIVHRLPHHYKKRYWEYVLGEAKPVHYRKPTSRYEWDAKRRTMVETEDYPIIGFHPPEADKGLWGGETVVKGYIESRPFTKKKILPRHWVPHFFFPNLKNVLTYSEILDKHMKITMTERTCRLIDQHFGLDLYLLETPELDIASKLGNKLKREILLVLAKGTYYPNDTERHNYIKLKYARFMIPVEEADWIGLDLNEACRKQQEIEESVKPMPEKYKFELDLVKRLASGEENPDHDKIIKELESESVTSRKAKKLVQTTALRLKKLVTIVQILITSIEMADSEKYVLKGKFETDSGIRKLRTDESSVVGEMEDCRVNVNQNLDEGTVTHVESCLSKKQMRKLRREQEKLLHKQDRRAREKMRKKMKRAAQREAGHVKPKRTHINRMDDSRCKQRVAIDMQFESLMRPKDIRHLFVQLAHAYAVNRRAANPLQFSVVGFSGPQNKLFFDNPNNHHWDVVFKEQPLDVIYEKNEIVYLTADSENSLQSLDSSKVYVIGGLLDHNSLKGHCLKLAKEKGYAHARLPIAEHVMLQTRKVMKFHCLSCHVSLMLMTVLFSHVPL